MRPTTKTARLKRARVPHSKPGCKTAASLGLSGPQRLIVFSFSDLGDYCHFLLQIDPVIYTLTENSMIYLHFEINFISFPEKLLEILAI